MTEGETGRWRARGIAANRPLLTLMLGHFTVDLYAGVLPVLYPLVLGRFAVDLKSIGLVALAYTGSAAVSQPLFGLLADRWGTRFTGLALAWTALMYSAIGFAPTFPLLIAIAFLAGLGSGAFHPMGAVGASQAIGDRHRNAAMSLYTSAGTVGVALGPVIGAVIFALLGLHGTLVMVVPGLLGSGFLLVQMRRGAAQVAPRRDDAPRRIERAALGILGVVVGVMMLRAWSIFGLQAFIPTWYATMGYDAAFYGPLATTLVLTSALGAIGAGALADRIGRRAIIVWSSLLSAPTILLFVQFPGPPAFLLAAAIGLLGASTAPLLLVLAQQLMAGRAGFASGLILGLGFVTGAIGVPITGAIADAFGLQSALRSQAVVGLLAGLLALALPTEAALAALRARHGAARRPTGELAAQRGHGAPSGRHPTFKESG